MINYSYRLIAPKVFRVDFIEENIKDDRVVIRPKYLSICAADERYYTGSRGEETLKKKLPMALIHEAVGSVVYDPTGEYKVGDSVVLIPNCPREKDDVIKENYLRSSKFSSSSKDGFMQDLVCIKKDRVIPLYDLDLSVAVLLELLSVGMNAMEHFELCSHKNREKIGVWGDGNVGFVTSLILTKLYPDSEVYVIGTSREKQSYFSFADKTYMLDELPDDFSVDHAFECVGGKASSAAINQIIDYINPQGTIALMGVSENNIDINTRMVLEKGLNLIGNSRSGYEDFFGAVMLMRENEDVVDYLSTIISDEVTVRSIDDIYTAFERDMNNSFKTVMKWEI